MMPDHCKKVSVSEADFELEPKSIARHLLGRPAFTRTEFMVLRGKEGLATARVAKKRGFQLFRPVIRVEVLSTPGDTLVARDPETDILNPTMMYRCARKGVEEAAAKGQGPVRHPDAGKVWTVEGGEDGEENTQGDDRPDGLDGWTVVVEGVDGHISLMHRPRVTTIKVLDLVPPSPSRLMRLLEKAVAYTPLDAEPVVFEATILDINELTAEWLGKRAAREADKAGESTGGDVSVEVGGDIGEGEGSRGAAAEESNLSCLMFPCEASGLGTGDECSPGGNGKVRYLDKTPAMADAERDGTALVGCDVSRMIYRSLYGKVPRVLDICPRSLVRRYPEIAGGPALIRCCKVQDEPLRDGGIIVLPWGPPLPMVAKALEDLVTGSGE